MEPGMICPKCKCVTHCEKGVEPMNDCICKLPGEVITARCDIEGGLTWHNNGSCISCIIVAREDRKQKMADRHAMIMAAPPNPNPIPDMEDAEILRDSSAVEQAPVKRQVEGSIPSPAAKSPETEIAMVLRCGRSEIILTTMPGQIERMIWALKQ